MEKCAGINGLYRASLRDDWSYVKADGNLACGALRGVDPRRFFFRITSFRPSTVFGRFARTSTVHGGLSQEEFFGLEQIQSTGR